MDRRTFMALVAGATGAVTLPGWARAAAAVPAPVMDLPPGVIASGVAERNGRLVVVGEDADGAPAVWSSDGDAWRPAVAPPPADSLLGDVVSTGSAFLAVGSRAKRPTAWTSADGSRWDEMATMPGPGHLTAVASAGSKAVVGGAVLDDESDEGLGPLLASLSRSGRWGRTATEGLALSHGSVTALAALPGRLVVAGTSTSLSGLWATEGGRWVARRSDGPLPVVWSSLLPVAEGLLALGVDLAGDARLARSVDGLDWVAETVPTALARMGVDLRAAVSDLASGITTVVGSNPALTALRLG